MYCEWVMKIFGMGVGRRTESDWAADGIRSDGGRNPIGRRTESDRTADGIRSDGGRSTMTEVEVLGYIGGVMGVYILCYGVIYNPLAELI